MTTDRPSSRSGAAWSWRRLRAVSVDEAHRVLGSSPYVEDAVQNALIRAWTHRHACRTPDTPDAWVRSIARREALRVATGGRGSRFAPGEREATTSHDEPSLLRLHVRHAIGELSPDDRRLVVGRYWHDLPDHELAALFGIEQTTVRVRLHRIRRRLRQNLVEE